MFSRWVDMVAMRHKGLYLIAEDLLLSGLDHFMVIIPYMSVQALFLHVRCWTKTAFVLRIILIPSGTLPVRNNGVPRQCGLAWPVGGPEIKEVCDRAPVEALAADDGAPCRRLEPKIFGISRSGSL